MANENSSKGDNIMNERKMKESRTRKVDSSNRLYIILLIVAVAGSFQTLIMHSFSLGMPVNLSDAQQHLVSSRSKSEQRNTGEAEKAIKDRNASPVVGDSRVVHLDEDVDNDSSNSFFKSLFGKSGFKIDEETLKSIPSHTEFVKLYGPRPIIEGLDTCATYRDNIPVKDRVVGPAGIFNTGTNLMAELLSKNCRIPGGKSRAMKWQVPWGKHSPTSFRLWNIAIAGGKGVVQTDVLPVVTIKDPYTWMASMCRHSYSANWPHKMKHCPNLLPNEEDFAGYKDMYADAKRREDPVPVRVRFKPKNSTDHTSLAGLWNDWYGNYNNITSYPRLIVRFEDFLLYPEEVLKSICECAGGALEKQFSIVTESAKGNSGSHSGAMGLLMALQKYGNEELRRSEFTERDAEYARIHLDPTLMKIFGYKYIMT